MVRTKSVRRGCDSSNRNSVSAFSSYRLAGATGVFVLLVWTGACAGASGLGIGVKIGAQTLEDPIDRDTTTRARLDLEISSPRLARGHLDFAFTFGGSSLGTFDEDYVDVVDDTVIEESYTDRFSVLDARLMVRLYPLGNHSRIRPHLGAGIGYYWFLDYWEYEYEETFEDPLFPGTFHTFTEEEEGTDTLANGLFPFVTAGVTVPLGPHFEAMFEFQYDFDKKDDDFDLGGPIYMFGARFRF